MFWEVVWRYAYVYTLAGFFAFAFWYSGRLRNYLLDENKQLREKCRDYRVALETLVDAKDEKEAHGKTQRYEYLAATGWEYARDAIKKYKTRWYE